jgi:hypothetical protein
MISEEGHAWSLGQAKVVLVVLLKDGPWEVKETLLLRKHPSTPERHLCPQAIPKKMAIKPNL